MIKIFNFNKHEDHRGILWFSNQLKYNIIQKNVFYRTY